MSRKDELINNNIQTQFLSNYASEWLGLLTLAAVKEASPLNQNDPLLQFNYSIFKKYNFYLFTLDYAQNSRDKLKELFRRTFPEGADSKFHFLQNYLPEGVRILYLPEKNLKTLPYEFAGELILFSIYLSAKQYIFDNFKDSLTFPKVRKANLDLDIDWKHIANILNEIYILPISQPIEHEHKLIECVYQYYQRTCTRILPLIMNGKTIPQEHEIDEINLIMKTYEQLIVSHFDKGFGKELSRNFFILDSSHQYQLVETLLPKTLKQISSIQCSQDVSFYSLSNFRVITQGILQKQAHRNFLTHFSFGAGIFKDEKNIHENNYQILLNLEQMMQNLRCRKIQTILLSTKDHPSLDKISLYS